MSLIKRLSISSSIYTATTILRQGIYVLLLPLYTHLLSPSDFGILAVVNSVGSFLSILFCLGLNASITRFYFEYRDDQDKVKVFLSTTLSFLLFSSTSFGIILLIFGENLLSPVTGDIPFWPFIALIILIQIFQPFFTIYLSLLQTIEKPGLYAIFALFEFTSSLVLVIFFVTFMNWGVQGVLIGRLVIAGIFFIISFYALRHQIKFVINRFYLKQSLRYCIPIIPHSIAAHIYNMTDKIALNSLMGTSIVGLYNVGYVIGGFMSIVTNSTNRAYMPIYTDILTSKRQQGYQNLKNTGILLVVFYCWTGSVISIFSKEIIMLMTNNAYSKSFTVVPFLAFTFVLHGIYALFVSIFFYLKNKTKFVAIFTGIGAFTNIVLNFYLIPKFGMTGAALATLLSKILSTTLVGIWGNNFEIIKWQYNRISLLFIVAFSISMYFTYIELDNFLKLFFVKIFILVSLLFLLSTVAWRKPLYLLDKFCLYIRKYLGSAE